MPRLPIDYSKTIIYKLVCRNLSVKELYVGSTTNWDKRKNSHKTDCNNENGKRHHYKVYQYIRANGGFENWNIIMVEKYPCETQHESAMRERFWTETLGAILNSNVQGQTDKEYREIHKEEATERSANFYKINKEQIAEKSAIRYQKNKDNKKKYRQIKITCDCGSIICKADITKHNKSKKHINFIQANEAIALPLG